MGTRLGELLVRRGLINPAQHERALEQCDQESSALAPALPASRRATSSLTRANSLNLLTTSVSAILPYSPNARRRVSTAQPAV